MDTTYQVAFSEPRFSTNVIISSMKKKEKMVVQILATQFHTNPMDEPWSCIEIKSNPLMKDLIINGHAGEHHVQVAKRK